MVGFVVTQNYPGLQRTSSSLCMKNSLKRSFFLLQGECFKARGRSISFSVFTFQRWGVHRRFPVCTVESNHGLGGGGSSCPCCTVRSFPAHFSLTDALKKLCQEPKKLHSIPLEYISVNVVYHPKKNSVLFSKPCFLSQVTGCSLNGHKWQAKWMSGKCSHFLPGEGRL